ncbi:MAG: hypothetical protein AAFP69_23045, partial [Planctomycetota bacterium]
MNILSDSNLVPTSSLRSPLPAARRSDNGCSSFSKGDELNLTDAVAARVFAAEFPFLPKPHLSFITMRTHVITTVLFLAIALGGLTQGQIHAQDFAPAKPTQQ